MPVGRARKRVLWIVALIVVAAAAAWHWQSRLIGVTAQWYLGRIAAREEADGDLTRRRAAVARMHRILLIAPPADALVPELFDLVTGVSTRVASGEINFPWAAYVYTSYARDLVRDRPNGTPRRSIAAVKTEIEKYVQFYALQQRPDVPGVRLNDFLRGSGQSYTVEEIEQAAKEGRKLE